MPKNCCPERFQNKRQGKNVNLKGIDFMKSMLNIKDKKPIVVKVNNYFVTAYIAHKMSAGYLW